MRRRDFLAAASAAALARPSVARAQRSSVLKFVPFADLGTLDPIWTTTYVTRCHAFMVFDTLYGQAGAGQGFAARPQMVAGHTVEDGGRVWKLTLREGLLFHDGTKVLARDAVASIRRWAARDTFGQALMQRADEVSAPDDRTILFRMKTPFGLLPDALGKFASNMCAIMPERLADTDPFKALTEMVGSGPFRFKADERVPGSQFVYERFRDYRPREDGETDFIAGPKVAHFDRVEWHIIPDQATAVAALQAGEIDWIENVSVDLLAALRGADGVTVQPEGSTGYCGVLRPNHLFPPFDNPAIRRALLGALDQRDFMTAAVGTDPSGWRIPAGFFPPGSPMASTAGLDALTGARDDAAVGRQIRAAGYRGEPVVLLAPTDIPQLNAFSAVVADCLQKVGMQVDYQATDWGTAVQRRASKKPPAEGGWNALCTAFQGLDQLSPATHVMLRGGGEQAAWGWPSSPRLEALREQWFDAPDAAARESLCAAMQVQAFADVPYYPLGVYYVSTAYRSNLTGVLDGQPLFWNVRRG